MKMRAISWLGLTALLVAGCQTTSSEGVDFRPNVGRIAAQFEASVFSSDFGEIDRKLHRWENTPTIRYVGERAVAEASLADLKAVFDLVRAESRIYPTFPAKPEEATYYVAFAPRRDYPEVLRLFFAGDRLERVSAQARQSNCFGVTALDESGSITFAVVLVDPELTANALQACLYEEVIQSLGLLADSCQYRPSIFCEEDRDQVEPTEADRVLLRTLYDPRLKPGMTKDEAMPITRRIIAELWQ